MRIAMLMFDKLTQLDFTGPQEVLGRYPGADVMMVAKTRDPVVSETKLAFLPNATFRDVGEADILFVPGGFGQIAATDDPETVAWVGAVGSRAKWVTSACTGSLLLGRAGLLDGYRAATHWAYMDLLPLVGAIPTHERVVIDRNRITSGGVTAGIDCALQIIVETAGRAVAEAIALNLEYDPQPALPGHPRTADASLVEGIRERLIPRYEERRKQLTRPSAIQSG
ncbi:MAG: DJ-1/PfpI family protein [Kofleriaceae bacterium]